MKKVFFILVMMICSVLMNAEPKFINGNLILTKVEKIENVNNAVTMYSRALETLSDMTSSSNIFSNGTTSTDTSGQDVKTVIYKGRYYLGFHKFSGCLGNGMYVYADFTLKIRCKSDKIQVVITCPSMSFHWSANNMSDETVPINEILPEFIYKQHHMKIKKSAIEYAPTISTSMEILSKSIIEKIKNISDIDDF